MKKIFIWGTGEYGNLLYDSLRTDLCLVAGAIDADKAKQGKVWRDEICAFPPSYLQTVEYDYVVIAVSQYSPILMCCADLGIVQDKILVLSRDWEKLDFIDYKLKTILKLKREIGTLKWQNDIRWNNIPYELGIYKTPIIRPSEELLEKIIKDRKSLCRFGDGELELMRGKARPWFQEVNEELAKRLKEVFYTGQEEVLIAVSNNFGSLECYTQSAADEIRAYLSVGNTRAEVMEMLGTEREYYDAYVSRPYLMYRDKGHAKRIFSLLKALWNKRNILLVEGEHVRTGVGNDLFQNVAGLRRILCPHANAFGQYRQILQCVKENVQPEDLVLLCLGPTATVLAYDICRLGIQAIDLGQIDNEYEWFLKKATQRSGIEGKAVSELEGWHIANDCNDREYVGQIVGRIRGIER